MEKRLYRSTNNYVFGGVCGGVGEYFNIDPVLIRLAWVIFGLMLGSGLLVYIVACLIIPKNPEGSYPGPSSSTYYADPPASDPDTGYTGEASNDSSTKEQTYYRHPSNTGADPQASKNGMLLIGLCLLAVGIYAIMRIVTPWIPGGLLLAGVLIALGLYFVFSSIGKEK